MADRIQVVWQRAARRWRYRERLIGVAEVVVCLRLLGWGLSRDSGLDAFRWAPRP